MAIPQKKVAPAASKTNVKPIKVEKEKVEKVKKAGVGDFVKAQILAGKDNDKILEAIAIKFPEANTSKASINWYRSALRKAGEEVPSSRKPKAEKPAKAPVAKAVAAKAAPAKGAKPSLLKKATKKADSEGGF